ncbi:MAG: hypothetical protein IIY12_02275 [Clostridia bacterium]|nr:hypothetical protein [Clostridia bacterium]MBQ1965901.1 hypothetical protein [Clostridia bacterium]MBQ5742636.1 hypothetical protein [Clostridia bacterium]
MKHIVISDTTLCKEGNGYTFKEKIEIARQLERLKVDVIELPRIQNGKTDILLVRTLTSFVKNSILSLSVGVEPDSLANALQALAGAARPRIRVEVPVSPVGMEYLSHKKPPKMLEFIASTVAAAKEQCADVEFCAVDATRAEPEFLNQAIQTAVSAGATGIGLCDSAAEKMPDDFAAFAASVKANVSVPVSVFCDDKNGLACASAILAVRAGVDCVKTCVEGSGVCLETFADMVKNCGNTYGFSTSVRVTELHRGIGQIRWIAGNSQTDRAVVPVSSAADESIRLDKSDDQAAVCTAVAKLGYDLSEEDNAKVYEEFLRVADRKTVGAKELDAIVASVALQVPAAYKLKSYVINNGNIISSTAQITLEREGKEIPGICIGDGPVDAAFKAMEQIIGRHYELDDFQIQSVTEGKEAMGSALVKLRSNGKLYSGNGISTDIMGAAIRAYINAVNKIVYEEA